jgi:hypothetical protein
MPQGGWQSTRRLPGLPFVSGVTDVTAGMPVHLASSLGKPWTVAPCNGIFLQPVGMARASAAVGVEVDVRDQPEIHQAIAAASVGAGEYVGCMFASTLTGASGAVYVPTLTPVKGSEKNASQTVWAVGQAVEGAAAGSSFGFYFNPTALSNA